MGRAPPQAPWGTPPLIFGSRVPNSVTSAFSDACSILSLTATCRRRPPLPQPPPSRPQPPSPAALCPAPRPQRVTPPAGTAFGVLHLCDPGPGPCSRPSGLARPSPTSLSSLKPTSSCHTHGVHRSIASTTGGSATTWACRCAPRPPAWASGHTHSVTSAKGAGCTPRPPPKGGAGLGCRGLGCQGLGCQGPLPLASLRRRELS